MNPYQSLLTLYLSNITNDDEISKNAIAYGIKTIIVENNGKIYENEFKEFDMFNSAILNIDSGLLTKYLPNNIDMEFDMPYKRYNKPYILTCTKIMEGLYLCDMKDCYYRNILKKDMWFRIHSITFDIIPNLPINSVAKLYLSTQFIDRRRLELIHADINFPHIFKLKTPFTNFNILHLINIIDGKNDIIFTHISWKGMETWLETLRIKLNGILALEFLTPVDFIVAETFSKVQHAALLGNYMKFNNYDTIEIELNKQSYIINMKNEY